MKFKNLKTLLILTLLLMFSTVAKAESKDMQNAIALTRLPDMQLQKTAIVTTSIAEYSNLKVVQTNTKTKVYLYYNMSASDIIEMVRADSPDTIYLMGTENDISKDIKTVFNVTVPTRRINQVELDESALKDINMDEALKIIKKNTETLKKNNILNLKWDSKNFEDLKCLKDKARRDAFIGKDIRPKYVNGFNDGTYFDHQKFRKAFEKLLNDERAKKGLNKIKYSETLQKGSDIRAIEQAKVGNQKSKGKPHTRPNGTKPDTAFEKKSGFWGECSAELLGPAQHQNVNSYEMKVYKAKPMLIQNEEDIAKALFTTWCNSPGHYKAMMADINKNFSISIQMVQTDAPELRSKQINPIVAFLALGY